MPVEQNNGAFPLIGEAHQIGESTLGFAAAGRSDDHARDLAATPAATGAAVIPQEPQVA
jgi:hypothetical protein